MTKQSRSVFFLILILILPVLACDAVSGLVGGNNQAAETNETAAENTIAEPGDPSQDSSDGDSSASAGPDTLDLGILSSGLQDVNSYRVAFEIRVEGSDLNNGNETVSLFMENATVVDPPASQTDITFEGVDDPTGLTTLQFISVGDTVYTTIPGLGCISGAADALGSEVATNPFADLFTSSDFIGDVRGARRQLPDETINGVETYHFVFDETALQSPDNSFDDVEGHIFIAKEGGYVVRLVMDGTGRINLAGLGEQNTGAVHLEMNTSDVNQPIAVQPPENCDTFNLEDLGIPDIDFGGDAADSPYPLFADNQDLFILDDVMSFQTEAPFADVVSFYQGEMPLAGFEPVSEGTVLTDNAAVLIFSQSGQNYFVTISEDGGTVYVQVVPE